MEFNIYNTLYGKFLLNPDDNISSHLIRGEFWEPELLPIFDTLKPEDTVVEVGSYIGDHTVYLSKKCKKVFTFEGCSQNYYQLLANLLINDCKNVEPFPYIMGNWENVRVASSECGDSWPLDLEGNASGARFVEGGNYYAVRLDNLYNRITECTLLKIDAEGMDLSILKGAKQTIIKYQPLIIFEYNELVSPPLSEYYFYLKPLGYEYAQLGNYNWIAKYVG